MNKEFLLAEEKLYILTFPCCLSSARVLAIDSMSPTVLRMESLSFGLLQRSAIFRASSKIWCSALSPKETEEFHENEQSFIFK